MTLNQEEKDNIAEEQSILGQTYNSLLEQQSENSRKFHTENNRARELTSQIVAASRDEDKVQLASDEAVAHRMRDKKVEDSSVLEELIESPYFARIILSEQTNGGQRRIEYKIGHHANPDCRIIDWRKAPLSKLYYEYKEGEDYDEEILGQDRRGKIILRNTVDTKRDQLKSLMTAKAAYRFNGKEWQRLSDTQGLARLGSNSNELPNILSLITPEQFRMITEDATTAVIVQGVAGSGKTTVALHRLAWLLHKDNSDISPEQAIVLVKNNSLRTYVSQTLPSINIHGVKIHTFSEWALSNINRVRKLFAKTPFTLQSTTPSSTAMRLKNSAALLRAIEESLELNSEKLISHLEKTLPWVELPQGFKQIFDSLKDSTTIAPLALLNALKDPLESGANKIAPTHPRYLAIKNSLQIILDSIDRESDLLNTLIYILRNHEGVLKHDETRLLDRSMIEAYIKDLLTVAETNALSTGDEALLLKIAQIKLGGLIDQQNRPLRYGHIVLDEAQDFSALHFSIVMQSVTSAQSLTIVGDTAQRLDPDSIFPGWDQLRSFWGLSDSSSQFVTLSVSHRSTLQIMQLGDAVLGESRTTSGRSGRAPRWVKCLSDRVALPYALEWLNEVRKRFPTTLTAVICSNREQAREVLSMLQPTFGNGIRLGDSDDFTFESGIVVADVKSLKGLEFNSVLLWNPSRDAYPDNDIGKNSLYTAITRAEALLFLVSWDAPSRLLPNINSSFFRGEDHTTE